MKVLLVTNDFPPRVGGIQSYLWSIYGRLPAIGVDVRVLAPADAGDAAFDATAGIEVVRHPGGMWWSSRDLRAQIRALSRDVDAVALGAVLPMNLAAGGLDRPVVVHTYGLEVAWARVPGLRALLRRIARGAALVTTLSDYTGRAITRAIGDRTVIKKLPTGVELDRFRPDVDGSAVRARHGLGERPVIACVSRLVTRKGQDRLIRALSGIRRAIPDAALLIVGDGPARGRLERMAAAAGVAEHVAFAGEVAGEDLPPHYAAADVFAMPARSRWAGLEVEGLGIVYLEAQATGRPAITGDSGGAPEAIVDGTTGRVVPGESVDALTEAVTALLGDRERARAMGAAGRAYVEEHHDWDRIAGGYAAMLKGL